MPRTFRARPEQIVFVLAAGAAARPVRGADDHICCPRSTVSFSCSSPGDCGTDGDDAGPRAERRGRRALLTLEIQAVEDTEFQKRFVFRYSWRSVITTGPARRAWPRISARCGWRP